MLAAKTKEFLEDHGHILASVILILVGLLLGHPPHEWLNLGDFGRSSGEALVIAGVLGIFVEPFFKRRLLKEASRGIFKHMIGFDHRPEIKDKLQQIALGTKLYAADCRISVRLTYVEGMVNAQVLESWRLCNPTCQDLPHSPGLHFERSEGIDPESVVVRLPGRAELKTAKLNCQFPGVYSTDRVPMSICAGEEKLIEYSYILRAADDHYHDFATALPLIGVTLVVENQIQALEIQATDDFDPLRNGEENHWSYRGILMKGDRITLRWFPRANHTQ